MIETRLVFGFKCLLDLNVYLIELFIVVIYFIIKLVLSSQFLQLYK